MKNKTLYKIDSKGKTRIWSIEVIDGEEVKIQIHSGILDGKLVLTEIPITSGKNLDKSNSTTPFTQALSEAQSKIDLQLRSGYVEDIKDAKQFMLGSGIPKPMLAQKYHPTGEQKNSKTLDKIGIKGKKIHVQPKLDGNRCSILVDDGQATMYTRKGDVMIVQLEHIISRVLEENDVVKEIILDGELFSDEMPFNELNGHLKRKDNQDFEQLSKIKYHLYDIYIDKPYSERYEMLKRFQGNGIEVIPSYEIVATDENIKEKLEEFLIEGHEGLMIRTLDKGYENKRTWQLVKCKIFEDQEFKILDLETDALGRLGKFIMELDKPIIDSDGKTLTTFKAGISGISHEEGYKILKNKNDYIGKMATIEFFGRNPRPRFPKFKRLRNE